MLSGYQRQGLDVLFDLCSSISAEDGFRARDLDQ